MPKINAHEQNSSNGDDSSSSDEERRRRKLSKKHKSKKEKKLKKKKKEKSDKVRKHKNRTNSSEQASELLEPLVPVNPSVTEDTSVFGPTLPPHLLNQRTETKPPVIGPVLPSNILNKSKEEPDNQREVLLNREEQVETEDESDDGMMFGPTLMDDQKITNPTQLKLEERALALKLAAIDGSSGTGEEQKVREEWMLELPEVGLKGGLAALNNLKRTFYQGKDRPDFSDRSAWTNTPMTSANASAEKPSTSKDLEKSALALYEHQRNEEQERIARKHKKKHKRDESLVEIHQKKLRKEQKKKLKELAASGSKPERRPFSRDVDLKLNKIDSHQTKQIVDKAKILNTKFSSGHSKYL